MLKFSRSIVEIDYIKSFSALVDFRIRSYTAESSTVYRVRRYIAGREVVREVEI